MHVEDFEIEFEHYPQTADDIPERKIEKFARSLVKAFIKQERENEAFNKIDKEN